MGLKVLTTPEHEGGSVPDVIVYVHHHITGAMLLVEAVLLQGEEATEHARSGAAWLAQDVATIAQAIGRADGEWCALLAQLIEEPIEGNLDRLADMAALLTVGQHVEGHSDYFENVKRAIGTRLENELEKLGEAA